MLTTWHEEKKIGKKKYIYIYIYFAIHLPQSQLQDPFFLLLYKIWFEHELILWNFNVNVLIIITE